MTSMRMGVELIVLDSPYGQDIISFAIVGTVGTRKHRFSLQRSCALNMQSERVGVLIIMQQCTNKSNTQRNQLKLPGTIVILDFALLSPSCSLSLEYLLIHTSSKRLFPLHCSREDLPGAPLLESSGNFSQGRPITGQSLDVRLGKQPCTYTCNLQNQSGSNSGKTIEELDASVRLDRYSALN